MQGDQRLDVGLPGRAGVDQLEDLLDLSRAEEVLHGGSAEHLQLLGPDGVGSVLRAAAGGCVSLQLQ